MGLQIPAVVQSPGHPPLNWLPLTEENVCDREAVCEVEMSQSQRRAEMKVTSVKYLR